jgi:hypothetical protein
MDRRQTLRCLHSGLLSIALCFVAVPSRAQDTAVSPAEWGDTEKESFLRDAEVRSIETLGIGITASQRASLEIGGVTHDAHVQTIDVFRPGMTQIAGGRSEVNFRDSYKFNIAAYRLDRLIGLNMIPVSVERRVAGRAASVTWWVDDVQMMELERVEQGLTAPDPSDWNSQMYNVRVFNELIYNTDPNLGNVLITNDWRIRLIDFTRAFRIYEQLRDPENLVPRIDRRVWQGIQDLTRENVEAAMDGLLGGLELNGLLERREVIVEYFEAQIAEKGEAAVVFDLLR